MASPLVLRRWFPRSQPQTLQIAVALLYWNAFLLVVSGVVGLHFGSSAILTLLLEVAGGFGVANSKRWGYYVAIAAALLPLILVFRTLALGGGLGLSFLSLVFDVALVGLLFHPMSRGHVKIWFS